MRKFILFSVLFLAACANPATPQFTPTVTPLPFFTATLMPTFTPLPSVTVGPPTIAPTIAPITASLTAQVNVRVAPDTQATALGLLDYGLTVQIIGKDASGKWWQIIYPENTTSTGWVTTQYAPVSDETAAKIPVVRASAAVSVSNETPFPAAASPSPAPSNRTASVKAQIFVRKGPAQAFDSLGMLNAGAVVTLTGRNETNVWVQIEYTGGPDGKGWVAAAYLTEGADLRGLPYYDNQGNLLFAPTAVVNPGQPTATPTGFSPAALDGDSEQDPAVRVIFSPAGPGDLAYSSQLSAPSGDTTDWVAFTPYEPTNQSTYVYFKLECSGNGGITATLEKNGLPLPEIKPLVCGNYDFAVQVIGGQEYMLVLNADGSGGPLRFVNYTVYIKSQR